MTGERGGAPREESMEERLEALMDSFLEGCRQGKGASISEYARGSPALASKIREFFPAMMALEEARKGGASPDGASPVANADARSHPARLGKYRLLREVGRGGMGIVYEAEEDGLDRRVAVKVLPVHSLMDTVRRERFVREARSAASLQHPHIVPIYGTDAEDGFHYYAMQFVEGEGLDRVIAEVRRLGGTGGGATEGDLGSPGSPISTSLALGLLEEKFGLGEGANGHDLPTGGRSVPSAPSSSRLRRSVDLPPSYYRSVARVGLQAAEALAYAHGRGILHRDIKPSNLLLDLRGNVWIVDFGLAKIDDSEDLTGSEEILGTLRYLAPERFRGRADARSDIYGLGLTLHEMLTLEPAFSASDRAELVQKVAEGEPPAPRAIARSVPRALERVVRKATARDPALRYQASSELAEDLQRYLDGRRIVARLPLPAHRWVRWARRRPFAAALAVVVALAALALAAMLLRGLSSRRPFGPQDLAVADLDGDPTPGATAIDAGMTKDPAPDPRVAAVGGGPAPERPFRPQDLVVADLDGDRKPDVVATDPGKDLTPGEDPAPGFAAIFYNRGDGTLRRPVRVPVNKYPVSLAALDLDGDGLTDLAVSNYKSANVSLLLRQKDGSYRKKADVTLESSAMRMVTADFDHDGKPDLAALVVRSKKVYLLRNKGGGELEAPSAFETGALPDFIAAADMDGDGWVDILTSNPSGRSVSVLINDRGSFRPPADSPVGGPTLEMAIADFDGDGKPDAAAAHFGDSGLTILPGKGDGALGKAVPHALPSGVQTLAAGDFDGDGRIDLAAAGDADFVGVLWNDGRVLGQKPTALPGGARPTMIRAADLDSDGDLDLVVANWGSIVVLRNEGKRVFGEPVTVQVSAENLKP